MAAPNQTSERTPPETLCFAIETSCDETSAAVVTSAGEVKSLLIASQIPEHRPFGGVVPELASRGHLKRILPIVSDTLKQASVGWDDIDFIATTAGPGLIGSLLVGTETAKSLAWYHEKPLYAVNHLHGHLASIALYKPEAEPAGPSDEDWPLLTLMVSGGHTLLCTQDRPASGLQMIGQTLDDAIGEAYDKVAKLLGLGYPGGPIIDKMAKDYDGDLITLPRPLMDKPGYDFSYSGLKTAVLTIAKKMSPEPHLLPDDDKVKLCASFQEAALDCLLLRMRRAVKDLAPKGISIVGGVACNSRLRQLAATFAEEADMRLFIPPPIYCTDNAAMIGAAAFEMRDTEQIRGSNETRTPLEQYARSNWPLEALAAGN